MTVTSVKLTERQERPKHIQPWDYLVSPSTYGGDIAGDYIAWHKEMADKELAAIVDKYNLIVHGESMQDDGWLDGFKSLHVIVETKSEKLLKLKWHDGNQAFMKRSTPSGGWTLLFERDVDGSADLDATQFALGW
jgi:hypothetical protein